MSNIINIGGGAGGGTSVVPNPQGTATDTLTKLGIEGTIYDFAGGGSSGHNYSTTEQVVGTWIDGSTLYEKTFVFTGTFFGDVLIGNINTSDIGESIDISGNMLGSDGTIKPLIFAHANARNDYGIFITTSGDVNLRSGDGYTSTNYISKCILTLRYTKSST